MQKNFAQKELSTHLRHLVRPKILMIINRDKRLYRLYTFVWRYRLAFREPCAKHDARLKHRMRKCSENFAVYKCAGLTFADIGLFWETYNTNLPQCEISNTFLSDLSPRMFLRSGKKFLCLTNSLINHTYLLYVSQFLIGIWLDTLCYSKHTSCEQI